MVNRNGEDELRAGMGEDQLGNRKGLDGGRPNGLWVRRRRRPVPREESPTHPFLAGKERRGPVLRSQPMGRKRNAGQPARERDGWKNSLAQWSCLWPAVLSVGLLGQIVLRGLVRPLFSFGVCPPMSSPPLSTTFLDSIALSPIDFFHPTDYHLELRSWT